MEKKKSFTSLQVNVPKEEHEKLKIAAAISRRSIKDIVCEFIKSFNKKMLDEK